MIEFTAFGLSQPAGSKRAFALRRKDGSIVTRPGGAPVVSVTDDNPKSKGWKDTVAWAAREALPPGAHALLSGPLKVEFTFFRQRPKGHFRKDGSLSTEGLSKPYPTSKPDALKLARAAEDALTGIVWTDDALIVTEVLRKRWGDPPRMYVKISWDDVERIA